MIPNPYFSGGKRRPESMRSDSRSTFQPFLMGSSSSSSSTARSPIHKRTRVSIGGATSGGEVEWSSLLNFQTPLRPARQRSTTLRRRETIHALPGQPGGVSWQRGGVMNASPGFKVHDRNERQSVARALSILDSRKRLRELSTTQCPEEPAPTPAMKKKRRLTINGRLEEMLQQDASFASTSLGEIAGRSALDTSSVLQKRCFTSVVPGNTKEASAEPLSKRLRPGGGPASSSSASTSASSVKIRRRQPSGSESSAGHSQSDAAQRRRLLSFMSPAQVEARYARQSAASELLSQNVSRSSTPSVSRRVSQVGASLPGQVATTGAQTELSCNQKEELHKSPSKEEGKKEAAAPRSRHCILSVTDFVKDLDRARSSNSKPEKAQPESTARAEVDSQARQARLNKLRKLLSDVTREPTPPASIVDVTKPTVLSSLLPTTIPAALQKQPSLGFSLPTPAMPPRTEAALPSLGAVAPTWSATASKPTPVITPSVAPVTVAAPTAVSQPPVSRAVIPTTAPGQSVGVKFGQALPTTFNFGQTPAAMDKPASKTVAFGDQKKGPLSLAPQPAPTSSTVGDIGVASTQVTATTAPSVLSFSAAPAVQKQPAFAFGQTKTTGSSQLAFGIPAPATTVSSATTSFSFGGNTSTPSTQPSAAKTPFAFGQVNTEPAKTAQVTVAAKPAAEVKPADMFSFTKSTTSGATAPGIFSFGAKTTTAVTNSVFTASQQGSAVAKPVTSTATTTSTTASAAGGLFQFGQARNSTVPAKNTAPAPAVTAAASTPFSFTSEPKKAVSTAPPPNARPFSFGQTVTANGTTSVANTASSSFVFGSSTAAPSKPGGFSFGHQAAAAPTTGFSFGSNPTPQPTSQQQPAQPATKSNGVAGFTFHPPPADNAKPAMTGFAFGSGMGAAAAPASTPFAFSGNAPASPQPPGANLFSQTTNAPRKKIPLRKRSTRK